ncbi:MAG TPA: CDP-glycerol glycerophosphotransferase family protein, partial [Moraxellaceae bacterium]|nr:CDP-glycerol glycerophosphotransferase family protein [Moraxellaceae bacterium]
MKIDKHDPGHWLSLIAFLAQALLGLAWRPFRRRAVVAPVILYGHKLNGNLLALYEHLQQARGDRFTPVFLTMDRRYQQALARAGINSQWACAPGCSALLAGAAALVSDHGLHSLQPLRARYRRAGLYFFDVWHGIPFKGFDADDFRTQHGYDETWVASDLNRELYTSRFGFAPDRVVATGYARTDRLLRGNADAAAARTRLGLPATGTLILFAPTWAQDTQGRSIYPFGHDEAAFLGALSRLGQRHDATFVLRTHLNTGDSAGADYPNVLRLPGSTHPDTEAILLVADMMICDWSSIAFDYLLLDRPTFFLDVPPPFRKGFSLGPEYRFGEKVKDLDALLGGLERCLADPARYWRDHGDDHR